MVRRLCFLIGAKRKDVGKIPTEGPSVIICVVNAQTQNAIMLRGVKIIPRPADHKVSGMRPIKFTSASICFTSHTVKINRAGLSQVNLFIR